DGELAAQQEVLRHDVGAVTDGRAEQRDEQQQALDHRPHDRRNRIPERRTDFPAPTGTWGVPAGIAPLVSALEHDRPTPCNPIDWAPRWRGRKDKQPWEIPGIPRAFPVARCSARRSGSPAWGLPLFSRPVGPPRPRPPPR